MRCSVAREALSARLDGEMLPDGLDDPSLDDHLVGCEGCAAFSARASELHRAVRVRTAGPAVDRTDAILAAVPTTLRPRPVRDWVRYALLAIALTQLILAVPVLLGSAGTQASLHVTREMGAFEMALAIGLLACAWRPRLADGLLPFAGALAGAMALTALIDMTRGDVVAAGEAHHVLDLAGVALLVALHPLRRRPTRPAWRGWRVSST